MVSFRRTFTPHTLMNIQGSDIEIVDSFKYCVLGQYRVAIYSVTAVWWVHSREMGQGLCILDIKDLFTHSPGTTNFNCREGGC